MRKNLKRLSPLSLMLVASMAHAQSLQPSSSQKQEAQIEASTASVLKAVDSVNSSMNNSVLQGAQSSGAPIGAAEAQKSKNFAQRIGKNLNNDGRTLNSEGKIVQGGATRTILDRENTNPLLKSTLGIDLEDPQTKAGKLTTTRTVTFNCDAPVSQFSIDGLSFKDTTCSFSGQTATGLLFKFCDRAIYGAACSNSSTFPLKVLSGAKVNGPNYSVSISCTGRTCLLQGGLKGETTGASETAAQAASEKTKTQMGVESAYQKTLESGLSERVADASEELEKNSLTCLKQQQVDMAAGKPVTSCDGSASITPKTQSSSTTSNPAQECKVTSRQCLASESITSTFNKECQVSYDPTSVHCPATIPLKECTISRSEVDKKTCSTSDVVVGDKCYRSIDSCSKDDRTSMQFLASMESLCTSKFADGTCASYTEYLWSPDKPVISGSCSTFPVPLAGSVEESCANKGKGEYLECQSDGWFLRSRPASECVSEELQTFNGSTQTTFSFLSEKERPGCGFCIKPVLVDACRGSVVSNSCTSVKADSCQMTSNTCTASNQISLGGSVCLSASQKFSCTRTTSECTQFKEGTTCNAAVGANTYNVENTPLGVQYNNDSQMAELAVASGLIRSMVQTSSKFDSLPEIFQGDSRTCRVPRNLVKLVGVGNNCCSLDLERPGGSKGTLFQKCNIEEVKLAGARRAKRAYYVPGPFCSKTVKLGFKKVCIEEKFGYCSFNDKLTRIIHEQGREQLNAFASTNSSNAEIATKEFDYISTSADGGWADLGQLNGVKFLGWQWPSVCKTPELDSEGICPPFLQTWIAACDGLEGCSQKPLSPWYAPGAWTTSVFDPLKQERHATSRYSMANGACASDSGVCRYTLTAFPVGIGSKAVLTRNVMWPAAVEAPREGPYMVLGNLVLQPLLVPGTPITQSRFKLSTDGGKTFTERVITNGNEVEISPEVKATIECNSYEGICKGAFTGLVKVDLKPWGAGENRDCSGFTVSQVSAMDFGRMDFTEWIDDIILETKESFGVGAESLIKSQVRAILDDTVTGVAKKVTKPENTKAVHFSSLEEFGPFRLAVQIQGNWPIYYGDPAKDKDPVVSASVDFDDCKPPVVMQPFLPNGKSVASATSQQLESTPVRFFLAGYEYGAPDQVCNGGKRDRVHKVKVTVTSASGTHTVTQDIINLWSDPKGTLGSKADLNGRVETTADALPDVAPSEFRAKEIEEAKRIKGDLGQ